LDFSDGTKRTVDFESFLKSKKLNDKKVSGQKEL
jgi:hypothetical protein